MDIQITRSLTDLFVSYFVGNEVKDDPHTLALTNSSRRHSEDSSLSSSHSVSRRHLQESTRSKSSKSIGPAGEEKKMKREIVYVKELRVGEINLNISTAKFKILNVLDLNLRVTEYEKKKQVGTWAQIGLKLVNVLPDILMKRKLRSSVDTKKGNNESNVKNEEEQRALLLGEKTTSKKTTKIDDLIMVAESQQRALLLGDESTGVKKTQKSW
eukprot:CAMPEP_0113310600 /NCGR_PEP_ID=MMETSP0010_2-20120614/8181_1 /TAXON_ID=216773 ORGANISM="Corethron hystrix, Strain 308" /NCGR_SAMPLE_ID=MMETSP0010_2 /ASSEMBLY_ACC=CAM_ASM_000155 /LENGTH=212 /DNA_ID=CAMNT_0000166089 /DNA_START=179 /DNA_END=814 /DNA_ORIENTATION=- /assembly_acc=CAM_ASM_000155